MKTLFTILLTLALMGAHAQETTEAKPKFKPVRGYERLIRGAGNSFIASTGLMLTAGALGLTAWKIENKNLAYFSGVVGAASMFAIMAGGIQLNMASKIKLRNGGNAQLSFNGTGMSARITF